MTLTPTTKVDLPNLTLCTEDTIEEIWRAADASPFGVKVTCTQPTQLRTKLYRWRKARQEEFDDHHWDDFSVLLSQNNNVDLWVKKGRVR